MINKKIQALLASLLLAICCIQITFAADKPTIKLPYFDNNKVVTLQELLDKHIEESSKTKERQKQIDAIQTADEEDVFGYDVTYVLKVVTAEAGGDGLDQCLAVMQCIHNAYTFLEEEYTPEEICDKYKYTDPAKFVAEDAKTAFIQIFIDGDIYEDVGEATIMYNPKHIGWNKYHESQIYVTTINDVRYFKETKWK